MKKLILLALLLTQTSKAIDNDKMAHIAVSYGLSYTGMQLAPEGKKWLAPVITFAAGLLKECIDDRVDGKDILANGLGIGLSVVAIQF